MSIASLKEQHLTSGGRDLETLVRRHQVGVWRYLRVLGAPAEVADDLVQETFLVAFDKLAEDRGPTAVASFLRACAKNLLLQHRRANGRQEAAIIAAADQLWHEDCDADDGDGWLQSLQHCLNRLDGRSQQAVQLFYRESRGRAEVAAQFGMKEAGLKTFMQRLRAGLRKCIESRMQGEAE